MTYIVGFQLPGMNAILADLRVTWANANGRRHGKNIKLKTGLLLPGCIYGLVGNVDYAEEFILNLKSSLDGREDEIDGFWRELKKYAASYKFPDNPKHQFQLLISTRGYGRPKFFVLDSASGVNGIDLKQKHGFVTLGSGKRVLDTFLHDDVEKRLAALRPTLAKQKLDGKFGTPVNEAQFILPYFICLWLSEWTVTAEREMLERVDVGGIFHFVFQTPKTEGPQMSAVYLFNEGNRITKQVRTWYYRVAHINAGGLFIERGTPSGTWRPSSSGQVEQMILMSHAAGYDIRMLDGKQRDAIIDAELEQQPYCFFCGYGMADRRDRQTTGFRLFADAKESDIWRDNNHFTQMVHNDIATGFAISDYGSKQEQEARMQHKRHRRRMRH